MYNLRPTVYQGPAACQALSGLLYIHHLANSSVHEDYRTHLALQPVKEVSFQMTQRNIEDPATCLRSHSCEC